jgi:hypothetical protein
MDWQKVAQALRAEGIERLPSTDATPHGVWDKLLRFTGTAAATLDDQFDSAALLSRGFDDFQHVEPEDFFTEDEWEMERGFHRTKPSRISDGRSAVTGC